MRDAEQAIKGVFEVLKRSGDARWESLSYTRLDVQKLLKKFGALLKGFVNKTLLGASLEDLFSSVKEYLEADESNALHAYERVKSVTQAYAEHSLDHGTKYALELCHQLATTLFSICETKFEQSGAGKPARLIMKPSEKKYPFHDISRAVNLGFYIENFGPGYAQELSCSASCDNAAHIRRPELYLGNLGVGRITIEIPIEIVRPAGSLLVEIAWRWTNFDGSGGSDSIMYELHGQPAGVDWDSLILAEPYRLEPVTNEHELVGRTEILAQLAAKSNSSNVGSACIWGQRRVGKTSIARTLLTRIRSDQNSKTVVLFLEAGEYVHPDPGRTIEQLGSKICRQVILADNRLKNSKPPLFEGALSPLSDFFDEVEAIAPELRFIIILDELDSVPIDLYRRGASGEAFFATIRSLSHKLGIGFVLVGGERMRYLFDCQGQALNKFQMIRVDYFDRSKHWGDFQDLIIRPTRDCLQFGDSALVNLYAEAAGNPFYTILICRKLFGLMVTRRDSYVTDRETEEAVALAIEEASIVNFQHFWDDGIVETGVANEEISMRRRYVLLALAESMGQSRLASRERVLEAGQTYGLDTRTISNELNEFVQREVLVEEDGHIGCKVPFFARWLKTVGPRQISTTYTEAQALKIYREEQEKSSVRSQEIIKLLERWPAYKGRSISPDHVRSWLEQFGRQSDQRLMFRLLEGVTFYSEDAIRSKMHEAHGIVTRGIIDRRSHKQVKKWPGILVSYLDGPGKSGARFAKLYIDENQMYNENLVERGHLKEALGKHESLEAVVFVDDFVGTGKSVREYLAKFVSECWDVISARKPKVFFVAACGFATGEKIIVDYIEQINIEARVHLCEVFDESYICFGDKSRVFMDPKERTKALEIAEKQGLILCKPAPLGYENSQALIVFSHNCPNNTLPILWEKSRTWVPLFRRD